MALAWCNSIMLVLGVVVLMIGRFGVPFLYMIRGKRAHIIGGLLILPSIVSVLTSVLGMAFWPQIQLLQILSVGVLVSAIIIAETDPAPQAVKQRARRRRWLGL